MFPLPLSCLFTPVRDYLAQGVDVQSFIRALDSKQSVKSTLIAKSLLDGASVDQIVQEEPGFFMMHKRKIEEFALWVTNKKRRLNLLPWTVIPMQTGLTFQDSSMASWLNANVKVPRVFKQKQLYIYGPTNMGKTTLINNLRKYLSVYLIPREDFYDLYEDDMYDLAVLDEFNATKSYTWMNLWLQGSEMNLRKKGCQALKTQNIPTIVLSNKSLEECYHNIAQDHPLVMASLVERFTIVHVTTFIKIPFVYLFTTPLYHQLGSSGAVAVVGPRRGHTQPGPDSGGPPQGAHPGDPAAVTHTQHATHKLYSL